MQIHLRERVRRFTTVAADGSLRRWHEAHLLVAADLRCAIQVARLFRQRGLVVVRHGQPARLVLIGITARRVCPPSSVRPWR